MEDKIPLAFGKHKGLTPEEIADIDPGYIVWLYDTKGPNECSRDLYVACAQRMEKKAFRRIVGGGGRGYVVKDRYLGHQYDVDPHMDCSDWCDP